MVNKSFLITGLSGVGKTTIAYETLKRNLNIEKVITSTTRNIRSNEKNGVDYYFYSVDEFEKMINDDMFFEYARVYDNLYGSEKREVERIFNSDHIPLFVCDVQGLKNLSGSIDNLVTIFIVPDSIDNLKSRIENRPGSKPEEIINRLKNINEEMKFADICDYKVINKEGKLDEAVNEVVQIINNELTNK